MAVKFYLTLFQSGHLGQELGYFINLRLIRGNHVVCLRLDGRLRQGRIDIFILCESTVLLLSLDQFLTCANCVASFCNELLFRFEMLSNVESFFALLCSDHTGPPCLTDDDLTLDIVKTALYLGHFLFDGLFLLYLGLFSPFLLLSREEDPIKEFHGYLDVVLELTLGELVARNRAHVKHEFFTAGR